MMLINRKYEHLSIVAGLLLGAVLLGLFNATLVFSESGDRKPLRLGNYQPGQITPFGGSLPQAGGSTEAAVANHEAYLVEGAPTITAQKIDEVLSSYGSPAHGFGQVFMDFGAQYGINPAYALAFYIHESHAGTKGVARFTKSIGNIRTTPGYKDYEGYRSYDTFEQGIEDWYKLIRDLYIDGWGLRSVAQILPVYAPPADNNDTEAYISSVEYYVDSWRYSSSGKNLD